MSEIPSVRVGQVWADNDPRSQPRKVKIVEVTATHAVAETVTPSDYSVRYGGVTRKRSKIRLDRFNPNRTTGYTLLGEED